MLTSGWMKWVWAGMVVATLGSASQVCRSESGIGLVNLDFESGKQPWGVWYSDDRNYQGPRFEYGPDTSVARSGKASMRIVATSRDGRAFVHQSTDRFRRGARYEICYWLKVSSAEVAEHCLIRLNIRKPGKGGKGWETRGEEPIMFTQPGERGWLQRRGCFVVDRDAVTVQLGLYVRDTVGTAWFDDISFRDMSGAAVSVDSMYTYYPQQVELGSDMVRRFRKLADERPPVLERAKTYNRLLVDVAHLTEDARRLQRCAWQLQAIGKTGNIFRAPVEETEQELDALYQTYGRLFLAKQTTGLEDFDRRASRLSAGVHELRGRIAEKLAAIQKEAKAAFGPWPAPPAEPAPRPVAITPDGRPNQIVIGTRSPYSHFEMEEPLGINRLHSISAMFDSKSAGPGKYDFTAEYGLWQKLKDLGATQASIGTPFAVHDKQVTPSWFLDRYRQDADIFMVASDGAKLGPPTFGAALNIWRPEVRDMTVDAITGLCRAFRDRKEFLWYVTAAENLGPYIAVDRGVRSIGYNASALPDFHAWLKERYGDIAELNRQWKTVYARFDEIKPPPDLCVVGAWPRPLPLGYEFQSWREDRHWRWQKLIYDTFKRADPGKAVFASASCFLRSLDGSRLFDTTDIMDFHARSPHFMLGTIYMHSLNRFAGKQLGQYECFWGCQEDLPRIGEEKVQRAAMMKYLYRMTTWGFHVQIWWYAYTAADYLLSYNGNWFNPVYDLSTLRYCAAALPVGKSKVKRLEEVFLDSTIVPARVVMVQPNTSMLFQRYAEGESFLEMLELHELLFGRNDLYELIPETYFTDGRARFDDFDVVILPFAPCFPDGLADRLRTWVARGGLLVSMGPMGLYDKFGFDRASLWNEAFGTKTPVRLTSVRQSDWHWGMDGKQDGPEVLEATLGKGTVLVTLRTLRNRNFYDKMAQRLVEAIESRAHRPARCTSTDLEFSVHRRRDGRQYLAVINRNVDRAASGDFVLAGRFRQGIDLDVPGGFPVPFQPSGDETRFSLRLEPAEFTIIALEP